MSTFDVFDGDADGICALHPLRLAAPCASVAYEDHHYAGEIPSRSAGAAGINPLPESELERFLSSFDRVFQQRGSTY
ncbi:MAG: hypothetical protein K8H84_00375 [Sulfuricella denitrificans]|nr:hypothetical protein [Sulfuricella denitrificans]